MQFHSWSRLRAVAALVVGVFLVGACSADRTVQPETIVPASSPRQSLLDSDPTLKNFIWDASATVDDQGPNDAPAQSDLNSFNRGDNIAGKLGVAWTWDDINSWTGSGQTGDACALFDLNGNKRADYALCVRITNSLDGLSVFQLPTPQSPLLYACGDKQNDRCAQQVVPKTIAQSKCMVENTHEAFPGQGDDGQDVLAACAIDLSEIPNATKASIMNVCSYPSGSPNSNPFDCVLTPGAGYLQIKKSTTPDQSGVTFTFDVTSSAGTRTYSITDNATGSEVSALIPVVQGTTYSIIEKNVPAGWSLTSASCSKGGATKSGNTLSNVTAATGEINECTFSNRLATPTISVSKTAAPASLQETGGDVIYQFTVTNTSATSVTLSSLVDDKFGNMSGQGTCNATGGTTPNPYGIIAAGGTYSCQVQKSLPGQTAGSAHTNEVTATASYLGLAATAKDDATVAFTDVKPSIEVTKSANPTSVPETGANVTYTFKVKNTSTIAVVLDSLADDRIGASATKYTIGGQGSCAVGGTIAAGATYECTITVEVKGDPGSLVNTMRAVVRDADGNRENGSATATVTITDVLPQVTITKTAGVSSVPETGGSVTYTFVVTNSGTVDAWMESITDDTFGSNPGDCTPFSAGTTKRKLLPSDTYTCTLTTTISGAAGTSHVNVVTVVVKDKQNNSANDTDDASVSFTDVLPDLAAALTGGGTASQTSGGLQGFTAQRVFTTNPSDEGGSGFQFVDTQCDDAGVNDQPAQVDLNCFERADNVAGKLGVRWTWDDINAWTGSGQTGDACALLDTDNDGSANYAFCARVTNNATGTEIIQVGGAGSVDLYQCNDSRSDRCAKQVTKLTATGSACTIAKVANYPGGDDDADVRANCELNLANVNVSNANSIDLLNVCSYPSGEPNSNAFDCIIRQGSGFLRIIKNGTDGLAADFGYTLTPGATDGDTRIQVANDVRTSLIAMGPTTALEIAEVMPSGWSLTDVTCTIDNVATGTKNVAASKITAIAIKTGQTTECTFVNAGTVSATLTYMVTATNTGPVPVTLDSLVSNVDGALEGKGTCSIFSTGTTKRVLAAAAVYSCSYTRIVTNHTPGATYPNTVTVTAKDADNNPVTKQASVTAQVTTP